jgi:UDP-glucose 4-epimerase
LKLDNAVMEWRCKALDGLRGKRVLVTGASGYLAANLLKVMRNLPCEIVRVSRSLGEKVFVGGRAKIIDREGDVRDRQTWERALDGVEIVFHLAAQTSAHVANKNPEEDWRSNVLPMLHLMESCKARSQKCAVLFSSTVTVTGIPHRLPVDESHEENPLTLYDLHKLMAERYLLHYSSEGHVRGVVLRLANVYGPGPKVRGEDRGILNRMARTAITEGRLEFYGGDYLRDYIHVEDVVWAFLSAASQNKKLGGRYFVIGRGEGHTLEEAVKMVSDRTEIKTGKRTVVSSVEPPRDFLPIDRRNFVADSRSFSEATGWRPVFSFSRGIENMIEALL